MEEYEYSYNKNNSEESGIWIESGRNVIVCSKCSHTFIFVPGCNSVSEIKHCPNCKEKMKGISFTMYDGRADTIQGRF